MMVPVAMPATERLETLVPAAIQELAAHRTNGAATGQLASALIGPLRNFMQDKGWGLEDPEQAAAEALSLALASLENYDPARGAFMPWVWGLARNHLRGLLRREARKKELQTTPTTYEAEHAERHFVGAMSKEQRASLLLEVLRLSEDDYQLLFQLFMEGADATSVAKVLGIKPATVRQRKRRLIGQLEHACRQH